MSSWVFFFLPVLEFHMNCNYVVRTLLHNLISLSMFLRFIHIVLLVILSVIHSFLVLSSLNIPQIAHLFSCWTFGLFPVWCYQEKAARYSEMRFISLRASSPSLLRVFIRKEYLISFLKKKNPPFQEAMLFKAATMSPINFFFSPKRASVSQPINFQGPSL